MIFDSTPATHGTEGRHGPLGGGETRARDASDVAFRNGVKQKM